MAPERTAHLRFERRRLGAGRHACTVPPRRGRTHQGAASGSSPGSAGRVRHAARSSHHLGVVGPHHFPLGGGQRVGGAVPGAATQIAWRGLGPHLQALPRCVRQPLPVPAPAATSAAPGAHGSTRRGLGRHRAPPRHLPQTIEVRRATLVGLRSKSAQQNPLGRTFGPRRRCRLAELPQVRCPDGRFGLCHRSEGAARSARTPRPADLPPAHRPRQASPRH